MNDTFKCDDCGLHYDNEQDAKDCYAFCIKHKACSIDITKKSIEAVAKLKAIKEHKH